MTFQSKKPPINITLAIDEFNKVIEYISKFELSENEDIKNKSIKLKEKLLKYSVPIVDNDKEMVSIRFFVNEVSDILNIFLRNIDINPTTEYYTVLLKVRDKLYVRK